MSKKADNDINLEELSKEELIVRFAFERKRNKKRIKKIRNYNADTEIALAAAIDQREDLLEELALADLAIINIVEGVLKSKGLPALQS